MKYLLQFLLLMIFVLLGEAVYAIVPLPIPSSIWGLLLLLTALLTGIVKQSQIENIANMFFVILPILFVAPAVGVLEVFGDIAEVWPAMLAVVVITYLAAMASTGWLAEVMVRIKDASVRRRGKK
ncbi:MAG: CidA/LrgA family protein [Alphaproteobacteria bacterium]|nr:CidA/LrgA family protein [Alphaproteobacteria bacterium]